MVMTKVTTGQQAGEGKMVTTREMVRTFGRIGLLSFGGPAGQIALMHRTLVDEKMWLDEKQYLHALNFCMLLPGPEAQQLATYSGWLVGGVRGGLIAGVLFVLPGLVAMLALSGVYALYGNVPFVEGLFFGLKAAVLAIVVQALLKIAGRALNGVFAYAVAIMAFVSIFGFGVPFPLIVLSAGLIGLARYWAQPSEHTASAAATIRQPFSWRTVLISATLWLLPSALLFALLGQSNTYSTIASFFSQMAVVTFGGAYAVLTYVAQQAVDTHGWLAPGEMLDGLGLAETTPGPLIMVTQFVGFLGAFRDPGSLHPLVAGTFGALLTTWVTFAPCFLWIFAFAPFIERLRGNARLSAALSAITAAVVGVIANLALWFALHVLFGELRRVGGLELPVMSSLNWAATLLTVLSIAAIFWWKLGVLRTLALSAGLGLALAFAGLV